jgi:F-type H+-transporting ATPase subunit b
MHPKLVRYRNVSAWAKVRLRAVVRLFGFLFAAAVLAAPALAQEGADSPTDSATGHTLRWLNFAIVIGLIGWAVAKGLGPAVRRRADEISGKIAEGTRAREAAERQRQEIQAKVANLESEIEQLRAQAKRDADNEAQRLRDTARSESEKIEQAARGEVEAAARAGRTELKILGAKLSVELAEAMLRQELTAQKEGKLFETFVGELRRSVN